MDIAILDGVDDHWDRLVWASAGGTIFHTLRFLSYHHPSKFDFANFAIRRNGQLACVIPGGRVREEGRMVFRSPLGASFGGFVFKDHRDLGSMSEMVAAFTARLKDLGFDAIEMTVPPCCYAEEGDQGLAFVLTGAGYALAGRDATSVVKLAPEVKDKLSPAALRSARKAERSGVRVSTEGEPGAFYQVLAENLRHRGAVPTHSLEELETLIRLFPDRIRILYAYLGRRVTGGCLAILCNRRTALTFYICHQPDLAEFRIADAALLACLEWARDAGCRYLDLGTVSIRGRLNSGLARFKRKFGAATYVRERYALNLKETTA